jgi:hypothetical protein
MSNIRSASSSTKFPPDPVPDPPLHEINQAPRGRNNKINRSPIYLAQLLLVIRTTDQVTVFKPGEPPKFLASAAICITNSRVGAIMTARGSPKKRSPSIG